MQGIKDQKGAGTEHAGQELLDFVSIRSGRVELPLSLAALTRRFLAASCFDKLLGFRQEN